MYVYTLAIIKKFNLKKKGTKTHFTNTFSNTLSREYRVVRNRYSRLLFTSEDRLCANLR